MTVAFAERPSRVIDPSGEASMPRTAAHRLSAGLLALGAWLTPSAVSQGLLFTTTNDPTNNELVVFSRDAQGQIAELVAFPTAGTGTGASLGSQGAVVLSDDRQWVLAVNAGSNDVSVFHLTPAGLVQTDLEPSGGTQPVSVTIRNQLVYVLNAGVPNNITGFNLSINGELTPIANSTHLLSASSTQPAQVQLSPLGDFIVVSEKSTNVIDTFTVAGDGTLPTFVVNPSAGQTPFGFAFQGPDHIFASEAFNNATDASAVTSYHLAGNGLALIAPSVPTTETSACWVVATPDGLFVYTANTGSDSITGFSVGPLGVLTRLDNDGVTATTGGGPTDLAFTPRTRFLYVLNSHDGTISSFERATNGSLNPIQPATGNLPLTATGLAAL
jgi:6-phosphogluconolactonase